MSSVPAPAQGMTRAFIGLDIGGSLAKVVYFEPDGLDLENRETKRMRDFIFKTTRYGATGHRETSHSIYSPDLEGTMHFIKFQTSHVRGAVEMMQEAGLAGTSSQVYATGGGAMKFADLIHDQLGLTMHKTDELECLIIGMSWLCHNVPQELYRIEGFKFSQHMHRVPYDIEESLFPFLVVNIGSGVSMLHVTSPTSYERVGGTSLGGATFYGLVSLLTDCTSFEEALELAEQGDNKRVDMLVRDIYGGDYEAFNLRGTAVASSFGKMLRPSFRRKAASADLARATLLMITNNIGSIAHMHAKSVGTSRIIFSGNFLLKNQIAHRTLSYATSFWSGGERQALFLRHEGYCGAVGALLRGFEPNGETAPEGADKSADHRARSTSIGMAPRPELVRIESRNVLESQLTAADRYMEAMSAHRGQGAAGAPPLVGGPAIDCTARPDPSHTVTHSADTAALGSDGAARRVASLVNLQAHGQSGPPDQVSAVSTSTGTESVGIKLEDFGRRDRRPRASPHSDTRPLSQTNPARTWSGTSGEAVHATAAVAMDRPPQQQGLPERSDGRVNSEDARHPSSSGSRARHNIQGELAPSPPLTTPATVGPLRFPASASHGRDLGSSLSTTASSPRWSTGAAGQHTARQAGMWSDRSPGGGLSTGATPRTTRDTAEPLTPLFGQPKTISGLPVGAPRAVWIDPSAQDLNPGGPGKASPPDASVAPGRVAAWARQLSSGEVDTPLSAPGRPASISKR